MARSSLEPLLVTRRGVGVLDRSRDPRNAVNPFWAAVGAIVALLILLGVLVGLGVLGA
jgi:hypothetical protein